MSNGGKAKWCARQSGVVRGEEDAWRVAVELPSAELQRGREMANCRRRDSSRLRRHESSPPAVQAVWNGRGKPLSLTAPRWRAISWCQCASGRGVKEEGPETWDWTCTKEANLADCLWRLVSVGMVMGHVSSYLGVPWGSCGSL